MTAIDSTRDQQTPKRQTLKASRRLKAEPGDLGSGVSPPSTQAPESSRCLSCISSRSFESFDLR